MAASSTTEYENFIRQSTIFGQMMLRYAGFRSLRYFLSGSQREVPPSIFTINDKLISPTEIDEDVMHTVSKMLAFPVGARIPENYHGDIFWIYPCHEHAGFCLLINENFSEIFDYGSWRQRHVEATKAVQHGPAVMYDQNDAFRFHPFLLETVDQPAYKHPSMRDEVLAVHCSYFPRSAFEWITRIRPTSRPTDDIIRSVVRYGCDLVPIANKRSEGVHRQSEWRYSFSMAEVMIIDDWLGEQRVCFRILRCLLKKKNSPFKHTLMCSYFFKTLMLWACELKPLEFWKSHNFYSMITELLRDFTQWILSRFVPNYFVRRNNMIAHWSERDRKHILDAIEFYLNRSEEWDKIINACVAEHYQECTKSIELLYISRWLETSHRILTAIDFPLDNMRPQQDLESVLEATVNEFCGVFASINTQAASIRLPADDAADSRLETAETFLLTCQRNAQDETQVCLKHLPYRENYLVTNFTIISPEDGNTQIEQSKDQDKEQEESCSNEAKPKFYMVFMSGNLRSENEGITEALLSSYAELEIGVPMVITTESGIPRLADIKPFYTRLKFSPTVGISWFVTQAYLTNLYYLKKRLQVGNGGL